MSDFLAIDWEQRQLCVLDAQVARGTVRVRKWLRLEWPEELDPVRQPQEAGAWLRDELARLDVGGRQLLISLPREEAVVRQLDVPNAPEEELPELVRLQAETKSSSSLDRLVLDFLPLPRPADAEGRQVLMVTMPRERIDRLQELVSAAGLELASIGLSAAATAELVARVEADRRDDRATPCLVLARHGKRVEISVMRDRHLLFSHSTHITAEDERQDAGTVMAEIRRSFGALSRLDPGLTVRRAWVLGTDEESGFLGRELAEQLACEVRTLDPLSAPNVRFDAADGIGRHASYAGAVGMLLGETGRTVEAVDFLKPRKAPVKRDRRKVRLVLATAAVAIAAGAFFGTVQWKAHVLQGQIEERRGELAELQKSVEQGQPTVQAADLIDTWDQSHASWLDRMRKLNETLPGTEHVYFSNFQLSASSNYAAASRRASPGAASGPAHVSGTLRIQATGYAKKRKDAEDVYQGLATAGFRVRPQQLAKSTKDTDYPWQFELDVEGRVE